MQSPITVKDLDSDRDQNAIRLFHGSKEKSFFEKPHYDNWYTQNEELWTLKEGISIKMLLSKHNRLETYCYCSKLSKDFKDHMMHKAIAWILQPEGSKF